MLNSTTYDKPYRVWVQHMTNHSCVYKAQGEYNICEYNIRVWQTIRVYIIDVQSVYNIWQTIRVYTIDAQGEYNIWQTIRVCTIRDQGVYNI